MEDFNNIITLTEGNDTYSNSVGGGNYALLFSGAGNDYITNSRGYSVTIDGNDGEPSQSTIKN